MQTLNITEPGTTMLAALEAYRAGDFPAARAAARRARRSCPDATTARYADALVYDSIDQRPVTTAESSVRRFLIALDDTRYLDFVTPFNPHAISTQAQA